MPATVRGWSRNIALHGVATCGVGAVELPEKVSVGGWYAANDAHISHEALTTG